MTEHGARPCNHAKYRESLWYRTVALNIEGKTTEFTIRFYPASNGFSARFAASTMPTPWTYEGMLDTTGKVLPLNSKGPSPHNRKEQLDHRMSIETQNGDHKAVHSSVERGGKWVTFDPYRYGRVR